MRRTFTELSDAVMLVGLPDTNPSQAQKLTQNVLRDLDESDLSDEEKSLLRTNLHDSAQLAVTNFAQTFHNV